ncbi:hypothetical protein PHYSODRAFT_509575 [Phytophthora sojae]|uniref:Uncharacterized protein n=1 Tax=Phytophthora sojae (strain P6497) TaxID=1094619 RepID=G4ZLK3_PHYSP|nr:hypothetical protein PHYSODRAFT_509575 [Phytophthora sojae]EGZ14578.1 hypothetical protein PHYSODRAFT_509575 [Phytophthora sojae]|eukprot:XP_009528327.1 hypothetical protein PHYSODRAFT_509575 [Phytophthora sojae]
MSDTQLADQFLYQSSLKSDPAVKVSSRKRVPYVIDLNQGSYANGIITIDATAQLNGAEGFACLRDAYVVIPYKVSMKNTHASTALAAAANRLSVGLKCGVWNVIDGMSLEFNGKSLLSMSEYKLFANNLRAQAETSLDYVNKHGAEDFLFPDSSGSLLFSSATSSLYGDGYSNTASDITPALGTASTGAGVVASNEGFFGRGAFVPGGTAAAAIAGTWNYMLKIKLVDLHPIFKELDLMANPQIKLRFRVNQGSAVINLSTTKAMSLSSTMLVSGQSCPIMVASSAGSAPNSGVFNATTAGQISVAWGAITNSLEPTIDSTYFPFTTTRLYVPFLDLENPQALISKPNKTVRYMDYYAQWFYQRAGTGVSSTQLNTAFDLQLSASLKNAKVVALLPFAETSSGNFNSSTIQQFQSCFDSAPWTVQPGSSIRNFNVRIGSQQVFDISYDYDFQDFIKEFAKLGSINGDLTKELSNGLIDYQTWQQTNRVLVADVSRLTEKDVPQSIQVMGTNASTQGCNMLVLVGFENEMTYNRLTGEVLEYTSN